MNPKYRVRLEVTLDIDDADDSDEAGDNAVMALRNGTNTEYAKNQQALVRDIQEVE